MGDCPADEAGWFSGAEGIPTRGVGFAFARGAERTGLGVVGKARGTDRGTSRRTDEGCAERKFIGLVTDVMLMGWFRPCSSRQRGNPRHVSEDSKGAVLARRHRCRAGFGCSLVCSEFPEVAEAFGSRPPFGASACDAGANSAGDGAQVPSGFRAAEVEGRTGSGSPARHGVGSEGTSTMTSVLVFAEKAAGAGVVVTRGGHGLDVSDVPR